MRHNIREYMYLQKKSCGQTDFKSRFDRSLFIFVFVYVSGAMPEVLIGAQPCGNQAEGKRHND